MRRAYRVGFVIWMSRLSFAFGVLFASSMILAFAVGRDPGEPPPSVFSRLGGIGFVLAFTIPYLAFTWRIMMYGVFAGSDSVVVRRMRRSTTFQWDEIVRFETVSALDAHDDSLSWRLSRSSNLPPGMTCVRIRLTTGAVCDVTELNSSVPTWMGDKPIVIAERLEEARRTNLTVRPPDVALRV